MSSNYEWQQFQTRERVRAGLQQGEADRRVRQANQKRKPRLLFPVMLALAVVAGFWLLAACAPDSTSTVAAPDPIISWSEIVRPVGSATEPGLDEERGSTVTMADRIRLQDKRERNLSAGTAPAQGPTITMADRIRLQDKRERNLSVETTSLDE